MNIDHLNPPKHIFQKCLSFSQHIYISHSNVKDSIQLCIYLFLLIPLCRLSIISCVCVCDARVWTCYHIHNAVLVHAAKSAVFGLHSTAFTRPTYTCPSKRLHNVPASASSTADTPIFHSHHTQCRTCLSSGVKHPLHSAVLPGAIRPRRRPIRW